MNANKVIIYIPSSLNIHFLNMPILLLISYSTKLSKFNRKIQTKNLRQKLDYYLNACVIIMIGGDKREKTWKMTSHNT